MKKTFRFLGFMLVSAMSYGLISCGGDGDEDPVITVTPASISMHYEDTQQLSANGATSFTSNDEFVAKVDQKGLVTGGHVGTTQIIASNGKKTAICEVTITPEYNLYDTPILEWGASKSTILSKETHETKDSGDKTLGSNYSKGSTSCLVMYVFENDKLSAVMATLDESMYLSTGYYLLERYQPIGESEGMFVFLDALSKDKATTMIGYEQTKISGYNVVSVMYMPSLKSSSVRSALNSVKANIGDIQLTK